MPEWRLNSHLFKLGTTKQSLDPFTVSTEPRCMVATCRNRDQMPPDVDA